MSESITNLGETAIDSNAAIDLLGGNEAIRELLEPLTVIHLPFVVLGELFHGVFRSRNPQAERSKVDRLQQITGLLLADQTTTETYGTLKAQLHRNGRPIPENDLWIAALAVRHGLTLVTRDAHFDEVEGLATLAW